MTATKESGSQPSELRVLHVEDNDLDAELVARALKKGGFSASIVVVMDEVEFEREIRGRVPDIVLADYNLPQWQGMGALDILRREGLDIPLILVSGALGDVTAVECIKNGATDYVLKDGLVRLPEAIRRALKERQMLRQRRQAEQDLARKVEELARSNAELEQFAYIASHDLQEPLRMVATYTQLLAERYRGRLDENADKFVGYACEGASRMQTLIRDLLAFSRVGRNSDVRVPVDCNALMQDILQSLGPAIRESGAVVTYGTLPVLSINRSQMTQVLQNLIANAIKFRGPKPPAISVQAEASGDHWLFSVSDNGIGIAPEHADNIFIVFQRLHTRAEYPGNGIGLAVCKKIIEHCGGKIWVESQPGHGSTFKFTMVCDRPAEAEASGASLAKSAKAGGLRNGGGPSLCRGFSFTLLRLVVVPLPTHGLRGCGKIDLSPKRGVDSAGLAISLKRYPDTNRLFQQPLRRILAPLAARNGFGGPVSGRRLSCDTDSSRPKYFFTI
jgi:signal transduction histidine kinase